MTVTEFRMRFAKLPGNGWLDLGEALILADYASRTHGDILEVGCHYGRSTALLASINLERIVHCVDPWGDEFVRPAKGDDIFESFKQNVVHFPCVRIHRMNVEEWNPRPVGFAYLDGDHTYRGTITQIVKAQKCNPTIIAVHDVNDSGGGLEVKRACLELLGPWNERVNRLAVWRVK